MTGYGTVLYQAVAFMSWAIVAQVTSSRVADQHNAIKIAIPTRGQLLRVMAWCFFYLASLFYLFPASDSDRR